MCGGPGTRLDRGEKPLFEVGGEPMVERVLEALRGSDVETVRAVTSPHAPRTADRLEGRVPVIETAGEGYVEDLGAALSEVDRPVLTVVSDLPLLAPEVVDRTLAAHRGGSLTVCVPTALKEALGVSADTTRAHGGRELSPTGLNVVGAADREAGSAGEATDDVRDGPEEANGETLLVSYDARLAVNVNRPEDARVAEVLVDGP